MAYIGVEPRILSVAKSADYTITDTDNVRAVDMTTSSTNRTVTLPTAADNKNRVITIKKVDSGTGTVIVDGEGTETIDGSETLTLLYQYESLTVQCNGAGTAWVVIQKGSYAELSHSTTVANVTGSDPTMIIKLVRVGKSVTFNCTQGVGNASKINTSNPTAGTALPVGWRPSAAVYCAFLVRNNNTFEMGTLEISAAGAMTWYRPANASWTSGAQFNLSEAGGAYTIL
jgi:hypothetical protein